MKNKMKKIVSLMLVLATLVSTLSMTAISASAASNTTRTFDADSKVTLTVRTTGSGSIKFTCTGAKNYGHRCNAPELKLTVYPAVNGKNVYHIKDSCDLTPSSVSSTLKGLKKGMTYIITIEYLVSNRNICNRNDNCRVSVHDLMYKYSYGKGRDQYKNGNWSYQSINCIISNIKIK